MRGVWHAGWLILAVGCTTPGTGSSSSSSGSSNTSSSSSSSSTGGTSSSSGPRDAGVSDGGLPITTSLLTGHVYAPSGSFGIFDALVSIQAAQDGGFVEVRTAHTRYDGLYQLHGLPVGNYRVQATRGNFSGVTNTRVNDPLAQVTGVDLRLDPSTARFVVVTGAYDRIEDIVGSNGFSGLGFNPTIVDGEWDTTWLSTVANPTYLANVDVLFLNCGINDSIWELPDLEVRRQALRDFVLNGKAIYASDWAYNVFEWLFPEALTFYGGDGARDLAKQGAVEEVHATIGNDTLVKIVGRTAVVTYDLPVWVIIEAVAAPATGHDADGGVFRVETLATGTVHTEGGEELLDRPLAIKLSAGQGRAIYTTFHNEAQLDPAIEAILQYFVLSL